MCGILGFDKLTERTSRMALLMAYETVDRGRQSWGVTDGVNQLKKVGDMLETWELPTWFQAESTGLIFHCRHATHGAITEENQHPFRFGDDDRYVLGVHNGVISNHNELNQRYNRSFIVDSQQAFAHIYEGLDTREIMGYGVLAWYDKTPEMDQPRINFARFNSTDLTVVQLETGEIVFCSTSGCIYKSTRFAGAKIKTTWEVKEDTHYFLAPDPNNPEQNILWKGEPMVFGSRWASTVSASTRSRYENATRGGFTTLTTHGVPPSPDDADFDDEEYIRWWRDRNGYGTSHSTSLASSPNAETVTTAGSAGGGDTEATTTRGVCIIRSVGPQEPDQQHSLGVFGDGARRQDLCARCKEITVNRRAQVICVKCLASFCIRADKRLRPVLFRSKRDAEDLATDLAVTQ